MRVDRIVSKQGNRRYACILLRHAYRDAHGKCKHRTLANLTHCSPEEIAAIELALKHKEDLSVLSSLKEIKTVQGLSVGAVCLLYQRAQRLGLVQALGKSYEGKLALWLVMARLIDQGSRLSAVRLAHLHAALEVLGLDPFCEDDLYRAMRWLDGQQERIEQCLLKERFHESPCTLFLYDVTSSYLEGEKNAYGAYGYNRDKKKGKKQIVIGLLTDETGWPVSLQVYPGNTQDIGTFADQVKKIRFRFGLQAITVVGDRGMNKHTGIEALEKHGFHYITAITKAQIRALVKQGVFQMSLFDEEVGEVEDGGIRYILRRNPVRAEEIRVNREVRERYFRAYVAKKNNYLAGHSRAKVALALRDIRKEGNRLKVDGWLKVEAKGRSIIINRDEEGLASQSMYDGCYVLKTNLPRELATKEVIHARYKDLKLVEDAFRDMKTVHLEMRPVFVRDAAVTRAHAFIVMLAYMLRLDLEGCWKDQDLTVKEGLHVLSMLTSVILERKGEQIQRIPKPNTLMKELLDQAEVELPPFLPMRKRDVYTRKNLTVRRK